MSVPGSMAHRLDAGTQRYRVGIEVPRFWATSRRIIPPLKSFRAYSTFPGVIRRLRPPTRPRRRAAASPGARVFLPQLPLHLRQRRHDAEAEATGRGGGVDAVGQAAELDLALMKVGREVDQALHRIYPDGTPNDWTLDYPPAAADGRGRITLTLDGKAFRLDLGKGTRKAGARFDRFRIITTWVDGNGQTIFFDDLSYTCSQ
jgi:hypothetical protein